ncbi:mechanosensitive ion channel family protein [Myxococcaceae bacterium JPH2]|nr:mechanosensitive ion channel family protein [Myxococcaceae bacterium JPH2]
MESLITQLKTLALTDALPFFLKLAAVIVLWFMGRTAIGGFQKVLHLALQKRKFDATLIRYVESLFSGFLTILLLLSLLGVMGVETTSFAALLAAAGIAIGSAWSGLLSNFAAGVFLLVLRPFRVGEEISGGGISGAVQEIGLFVTTIDTPDNVRIFVGNSRLLGDNIVNFHSHPHRRVVVKVPLVHGTNVRAMQEAFASVAAGIPDVLTTPGVGVGIAEFTAAGPVLAVTAWCAPTRGDAVQGALTQALSDALLAAAYVVPAPPPMAVLTKAG